MIQFVIDNCLTMLLILGTCFTFFWLWIHRDKLKLSWWASVLLAIAHTLLGVLSVKVFAVLETLDFSKAGSMSLFGGIFFMPLLYFLGARLSRRRLADVYDVFTPCIIFTIMCARINCLFSGCCLGVCIPGTDGWRYPTREIEILFYIILLSYLIWKDRNIKIPGLFYPVYIIAYGAFRFVIEWFRESDSPAKIHISHFWAVLAFCLGLSIYSELKRKKISKTKINKKRRKSNG